MILWASLAVALFSLLPIQTGAEVVSFSTCSGYFYKGEEPTGIDKNAKQICQKMNDTYFYATLYSTNYRIPVYSAYTFDFRCNNQEGRKRGNWFIEPQLSEDENTDYTNMVNMKSYTASESQFIKVKQAVNEDYSFTGYDRGHLNPNSFQCNEGQTATFTLTNAAPMDPCFNRVHWKEWEAAVRGILKKQNAFGTTYLVTGVVAHPNNRIPKAEDFDEAPFQDLERVTVPTHVWTAVCYIHPQDQEEHFSFGFIGGNHPSGNIYVKTLDQLTQDLSEKYNSNNLSIFKNNCFSQNQKSEKIVKELKLHSAKSDLVYDSIDTCWKGEEDTKCFSEPSTPSLPVKSIVHDELRHKSETCQEVVCRLVPEILEGSSTPCLYDDKAEEYSCSDGKKRKLCSPTYSDVTVSQKKCRSDHTCGKHGHDYYWCYTDGSWDYCSPPEVHGVTKSGEICRLGCNCAKCGYSYFWCETNDGKWDYCCISPNPLSAVNGKTCKSDKPCDYYGYSYLWCYTTDGSWDYCCTK